MTLAHQLHKTLGLIKHGIDMLRLAEILHLSGALARHQADRLHLRQLFDQQRARFALNLAGNARVADLGVQQRNVEIAIVEQHAAVAVDAAGQQRRARFYRLRRAPQRHRRRQTVVADIHDRAV